MSTWQRQVVLLDMKYIQGDKYDCLTFLAHLLNDGRL